MGTESKIRVSKKPKQKLITEITSEQRLTLLKDLNTLIAERAGKTIRLDISSAPIRRIPITTVREVSIAIRFETITVPEPVTFEKSSSKVTEKILLKKRIKHMPTKTQRTIDTKRSFLSTE